MLASEGSLLLLQAANLEMCNLECLSRWFLGVVPQLCAGAGPQGGRRALRIDLCGFRAITTVYARAPPLAAAGANARGGRALGAGAHRTLARRQGVSVSARLARCEVSFGMLALGKDASKLALLACGRGRAGGPARLGEARRGSSSSRPATSQHGSSLDGSLPSMLSALCTASTSCLGRPTGLERAVSGKMAR